MCTGSMRMGVKAKQLLRLQYRLLVILKGLGNISSWPGS